MIAYNARHAVPIRPVGSRLTCFNHSICVVPTISSQFSAMRRFSLKYPARWTNHPLRRVVFCRQVALHRLIVIRLPHRDPSMGRLNCKLREPNRAKCAGLACHCTLRLCKNADEPLSFHPAKNNRTAPSASSELTLSNSRILIKIKHVMGALGFSLYGSPTSMIAVLDQPLARCFNLRAVLTDTSL